MQYVPHNMWNQGTWYSSNAGTCILDMSGLNLSWVAIYPDIFHNLLSNPHPLAIHDHLPIIFDAL